MNYPEKMANVSGISYKQNKKSKRNSFSSWSQKSDEIPFPDRKSMNNSLYMRPDTDKPMATIATSRGCGAKYTHCLTPIRSGTRIRYSSPESIYEEIKEC